MQATKSAPLSLKHFMLSTEARKLYRDVLRSLRGVEPDTSAEVRATARSMFAEHADERDPERIRTLLADGRYMLDQMRGNLRNVSGGGQRRG